MSVRDAGPAQPLAVPWEQLLERYDEHEQHRYEQCRSDVEHEGDDDRCRGQHGPKQVRPAAGEAQVTFSRYAYD